jgi:hypothetical protein
VGDDAAVCDQHMADPLRRLLTDAFYEAQRLLPAETLLFPQAAPANVASVRALLHAGFALIGAEALSLEGQRMMS